MRFELWIHETKSATSYILVRENEETKQIDIEEGDTLLCVFDAASYEDAKKQQHEFLGWEPYRPMQ